MPLNKRARLTPRGRALLTQRMPNALRAKDMRPKPLESVFARSTRGSGAPLKRARGYGRLSRPRLCPHAKAGALVEKLIELHRSRKIYRQIAQVFGLTLSTVARRLKKAGFHRFAELEPAPVVARYKHANPVDLLH